MNAMIVSSLLTLRNLGRVHARVVTDALWLYLSHCEMRLHSAEWVLANTTDRQQRLDATSSRDLYLRIAIDVRALLDVVEPFANNRKMKERP